MTTQPWETEYSAPKIMTGTTAPQASVLRFLKTLKKQRGIRLGFGEGEQYRAIDLGCGTGRAALYLAEKGVDVSACDVSQTAITAAIAQGRETGLTQVDWKQIDMNKTHTLPYHDDYFHIGLCVMVLHTLRTAARTQLVAEAVRIMRPDSAFFVRTLALEGDSHAKKLITEHPASVENFGENSYVMPGTKLTEHVFTKNELTELFAPAFSVFSIQKHTGYQRVDGRVFKRQYWECIFIRNADAAAE